MNQNNQRFKPKSKRIIAFSSVIFGILSILADASMVTGPAIPPYPLSWIDIIWALFREFSLFGGGMFLFPIIGLILGIISRKSKLGIVGIILSTIGLIGAVYLASVFIPILQQ